MSRTIAGAAPPLSRAQFAAALRAQRVRYWDRHPFHVRLHQGGCTREEVRAWVANRWYYQRTLSQKNAAIIAACPLPEVRQRWVSRIVFQEGTPDCEGGLAEWLALAEAVGLTRAEVTDLRLVAPGVRFAVDGYLHFCQTRPWYEGAAAALTELFSPELMADRVRAWRRCYPWIAPEAYGYFESRISVVREDSAYTLGLVLEHCVTREQQRAAIAALGFKCDVLWAMLDAIEHAGRAR